MCKHGTHTRHETTNGTSAIAYLSFSQHDTRHGGWAQVRTGFDRPRRAECSPIHGTPKVGGIIVALNPYCRRI